jgi:dephospho-CoA kinase
MLILLLSGWAGSGKDATARVLSNAGFQRWAFADELKRQVANELGISLGMTHTVEGKNTVIQGKTVREWLIQRGQEIRAEKQNPGYFAWKVCDSLFETQMRLMATSTATHPLRICISDWRLLDEYEIVKRFAEQSGHTLVTVRIQREGQVRSSVNDLLTEHQLDEFPFDVRIRNNGTWSQLQEELQNKLRKWLSI